MDTLRKPAKSCRLRFARRILQALEAHATGGTLQSAPTPERAASNGPRNAQKSAEKNANGTPKPPQAEKTPLPPRRSERVLQAERLAKASTKTRASKRARVAAAVTEEPMELTLLDDEEEGSAPNRSAAPRRTQRRPLVSRKDPESEWTLNVRDDEFLLHEVVEVLKLDERHQMADTTWYQIGRALAQKHCVAIPIVSEPKRRIQWLSSVWRNPDHPEHGKLTPAIKQLLYKFVLGNTRPKQPPLVTPASPPSTVPVLDRQLLSVLIQEALRHKPFLTNDWEVVAAAVNTQASATVFPNGESCRRHADTVLSTMDLEDLHGEDETTGVPRKVLKLLWSAMSIQWPPRNGVVSSRGLDLLKEMDKYLDPDEADEQEYGQASRVNGDSERSTVDHTTTTTNEAAENEVQVEPSERTVLSTRQGTGRRGPSPHMASPAYGKRRRSQVKYVYSSDEDAPSTADRSDWTSADLAQRLQAESDARRRLEEYVKEERNEWRLERKRLHEALHTMNETLTAERLAQREETKVMLGMIEREREDRRSEFVAMMNLVNRAMATPSSPRAQRAKRNGDTGNSTFL